MKNKRNHQKKKPLNKWAVLGGLFLIILQIIDKLFDLVLKVLQLISE